MRTLTGATVLAAVFAVISLVRPTARRPRRPNREELETAQAIVAQSPRSYANLALLGDKMLLFNDRKTAMILYAIEGSSWVGMGDPIGPAADFPDLLWQFRDLCDARGGLPVFYKVDKENSALYVDLGLDLLHLGDEARVPLADVDGDGRMQELQAMCARLDSLGCSFEIHCAEGVSKHMAELAAVSEAWLADGKQVFEAGCTNFRENRFSLGYFDPHYVSRFPVATVRRQGKIVGIRQPLDDGRERGIGRRSGATTARVSGRRGGLSSFSLDGLGSRTSISVVQFGHGAAIRVRAMMDWLPFRDRLEKLICDRWGDNSGTLAGRARPPARPGGTEVRSRWEHRCRRARSSSAPGGTRAANANSRESSAALPASSAARTSSSAPAQSGAIGFWQIIGNFLAATSRTMGRWDGAGVAMSTKSTRSLSSISSADE